MSYELGNRPRLPWSLLTSCFCFFLVCFFFNNFVFSFFLFIWRGREIVAGCVTSYNICFSQYYGGWKSRCIVMKLEITKRTVILSSRKKVCKGSRTQFLLFVSLLQSSFPLTTELEGSLIVFFGTNTFFCFTQKIASFTVDEDKRVDIKQISIAAFKFLACCLHNNAILSLVWGWIGLRLFEHLNPAED